MAVNRKTIYLSKGSGGSLLEVELEGFETSEGSISIHQITTNAKFKADLEVMPFNLGFQYSYDEIAQHFLVAKLYTTGTIIDSSGTTATLLSKAMVAIMSVEGNGVVIASGDATPGAGDHTAFGTVSASSGTIVRTFTIKNTGRIPLLLSGSPKVAVSGTDANNFTVNVQPTSPVAPNGSVTFQVTFDPSSAAAKSATLSIANNDFDTNPYTFAISGTGS